LRDRMWNNNKGMNNGYGGADKQGKREELTHLVKADTLGIGDGSRAAYSRL
jgi:hypothetical protein